MERVTATTIEELQQRLDKLAVDAQDGVPGAREEYRAVLDEISRLRGAQELQERAERQRAVQDEAKRAAQLEARRRALEKEKAENELELKRLAAAVDQAAGTLLDSATRFAMVAESVYQLDFQLTGQPRPRLRRGDILANSILWKLSMLPAIAEKVGRPGTWYRKPLAELLAQQGLADASAGGREREGGEAGV